MEGIYRSFCLAIVLAILADIVVVGAGVKEIVTPILEAGGV